MNNSHSGAILDTVSGYNVIDCIQCGFRHLDPIPTEEELKQYYDKEYFQSAKPEYLEEDRREIEHRNIFFDQRIDFFTKHAPGKTLMDIGCGDGIFLERAKQKGFTVAGIEPSEQASAIAKANGIDIFHGTLQEYMIHTSQTFDIVHLKNVLEHVDDPSWVLEQCYALMNANGILYIEVPNDYEPMQRFGAWINRERKSWICIPDHINYFNFSSASRLLTRKGFTVVRRDTTFPIYMFLCLGFNFIRNKAIGKKIHAWRVKLELFFLRNKMNGFRHGMYRILSAFGSGRTVILYSKK